MDEPFAALDALTRRKMQEELLQLWDDTRFTVLFVTHSIAEAITIARDARIPVVLTHHKAVGQPMWGKSVETLRLVDEARADGLDVMMDQYPYTASQTSLSVLIPPWALAGGTRDQAISRRATSAR